MIQEALKYLVGLGENAKPVEKLEYSGRHYTNKDIKPISEPLVAAIRVSTLSGLCDLLSSSCKFEAFDPAHHLVHVVSYEQVQVVTKKSNHWKQREVLADCTPEDVKQFPFGQFLSAESFTIGLLSQFADAGDREKVLKLSSNVSNEAAVISADDGVSQRLTVNRSVAFKEHETVRTVTLAPFRTFREISQPESQFVLRAKNEGENTIPKLALFEADGGKWKIDATRELARHLRVALGTEVTIVS